MKHFLIGLFLVFTIGLSAQINKTHKIKKGETIESIAKTYLVTPFDIYALNPNAKTNFAENIILQIPVSSVKNAIVQPAKELIGYKKHRVKRRETLYGIAKHYQVSQDDIKKENTRLYSEELKKGDKINIPRYKTIVSKQTISNTLKKYTVLPREGKWRIAYKFGIKVQELEALNPNINAVIQPGDILNVPNIADNQEKEITATYNYYAVKPKEGFYRLKVKFSVTQDQLEELNPGILETGLKEGMVIKLPANINSKIVDSEIAVNDSLIDLRDNLINKSVKRLAVLLPFNLHKINVDSVVATKAIMKTDKVLSTALDFHSGVLIAIDSAKTMGLSTDLKVYDTKNRKSEIAKILEEDDFSNYNAVIGPMMGKTFDRFATDLKDSDVAIFAPLAKPTDIYKNVYQTLPEKKILEDKIIDFVKRDSTKVNVVIIADQKHRDVSNKLKLQFPGAKQLFSQVKKKKDAYFIYPTKLAGVFKNGKNIVFLETDNVAFGTSVISLLNGRNRNNIKIVLTTTDKSKAFENNGPDNNYHLSNLNFHFASINKTNNTQTSFIKTYKAKYGSVPSKYATRGFDLTLDVLLRLSVSDKPLIYSDLNSETEYSENKFNYVKNTFGGFVNRASYIVKYDNLSIIQVE